MGFLTNEDLGQDSDKCKKKKNPEKKSTPKPDNSETNYTMQKTVIKIISLYNLLHKGPINIINIMAEQLHHANQPVASQNFLPAWCRSFCSTNN